MVLRMIEQPGTFIFLIYFIIIEDAEEKKNNYKLSI